MGKTTTIKKEIEIKEPSEKVWKVISDIGNICQAHPSVNNSFLTSEQKEGIGTTRHCDFNMMGASAEEKVTEWNEGKNIKIQVTELKKMPGVKTMELDLAISPTGNNTQLTGTMNYSMQNGFFDVMNGIMMKGMNAKILDGILAGHKKFIESGEKVDKNTKLDTASVKKSA